ncbi:hypothetical protein [Verrucomicrobium sp. 3C]|uniref:hypothetical protein n=1 Tax=Verrucomicrobium sp. 3C TaxID=1134055 RepID=UPI000363DDE8|nr:hypothetical protein [Verrucomicrobium sp. 3C]
MEIEKQVLVVVEADPEHSPRAAEGLRVAAGLSMHPELRVTVVLGRETARAMREKWFRRVEGEVWDRALAELVENQVSLLEAEPIGVVWDGVIRFAD